MIESVNKKNDRDPKIQFGPQLQTILYTPVSVENIGRFADDALEGLIDLNESVVHRYQTEHEESNNYVGSELEDQAYAAYGLENLNEILTRVIEVRDTIKQITIHVIEALGNTDEVLVPPDATGPVFNSTGSGTYEAPNKRDRLITLAYVLEHDFDLNQSTVHYTQGTTTDTMFRKEPYVRVQIEDLDRVVYVCDEEGNASYVFDTKVLEQIGIILPELDHMTKNQRNTLLQITPTVGRRIIQSPEWRTVMSHALSEPFTDSPTKEFEPMVVQSEFREKVKFLPFAEFQTKVRDAYEKVGSPKNIEDWYRINYRQNSGWPGDPRGSYKNKGWKGFPVLVGKEVIELLEFDEFVTEVKNAYEKAGSPNGVEDWYTNTYKEKPGWPAGPANTYKNKGWEGYSALVGKKTKEVVELLEFNKFAAEVKDAYEKAGSPSGVTDWYRDTYRQNPGWPAGPDMAYKNKGWEGFPKLVGKEVIELLEFDEFVTKVRDAYEKAGSPNGVQNWYANTYRQNPRWPANPDKTYKNKGWGGYSKLVNKIV